MHPLLQRLHLDHRNLSTLLAVLEKQLDDFHVGEEHDIDLMCELMDYVESYEDQVHHPTEDRIFEKLKAATDDKRVAVETLQEQHQILADMSKAFGASLNAILHEGVVLRHEVEAQGRGMVKMLKQHMTLEDSEVFPLAERTLSDEDWAAISEQAPSINDPVFGNPDPVRFRTLFQHLTTELGLENNQQP